jgi:hypothetical protein
MADDNSELFCLVPGNGDAFPCNASAIQAVSTGIAAGGLAILFAFFLTNKVNTIPNCQSVGRRFFPFAGRSLEKLGSRILYFCRLR